MSDDVRERFGARAERYVASSTHASGDDLTTLVEWADPKPDEVAIDVATGGGHVALALARRGARVTAVDLTPEMVDAARRHLESEGVAAEYVVGHAAALPFEDGSVDLVTCRIAAHHFRDPSAFFREAYRILVHGGRLAFQDQALPDAATSACIVDEFERVRDPSHRNAFSVGAWTSLVERAGFTVECGEVFEKRHDFAEWCETQSCSAATIATLEEIAETAPPQAREWLAVEWAQGKPQHLIEFSNRHLVLLARKP